MSDGLSVRRLAKKYFAGHRRARGRARAIDRAREARFSARKFPMCFPAGHIWEAIRSQAFDFSGAPRNKSSVPPIADIKLVRVTFGAAAPAASQYSPRSAAPRGFWHVDCFVAGMTDEKYSLVLLQLLCLLMFCCGFVVLTQHPEWFGV